MLVRHLPIGLKEALALTLSHILPNRVQSVELNQSLDRITAEDIYARVDSPSVDASLKDGYAIVSKDVAHATAEKPVRLQLTGHASAGGVENFSVSPGNAVRVLTGAKIPDNADAVLAEEYVQVEGRIVVAANCAEPGRNILPRGSDVSGGKRIVRKGTRLSPGLVGLIAAAGHSSVLVYRSPKVAIIATGDEVIVPGQVMSEGKLYASNMATLDAWCRRYGFPSKLRTAKDDPHELRSEIEDAAASADTVITSGGAWTGDRDLVVKILDDLGWKKYFHRIRIGPGKAVGFGVLNGKPVFILPGGPPSNLIAFLQIALPGLMKCAGFCEPGLPTMQLALDKTLTGRFEDWTQFVFGTIENREGQLRFSPLQTLSRLQSMAQAQALVAIPEGKKMLPEGMIVSAQLLI